MAERYCVRIKFKMIPIKCWRMILFIILVKMVNCSYRKIKDGKQIDESMRYMVYLLKSEKSEMLYDAWLCGGAIVSPDFIVTSAACVKDVQYMYAIAGYSKYVNVKDIDTDTCTKASKKKIVFVCVPRGYDLDYARVEKWANIDIAVAQVESPYDFSSPVLPGCSWVPNQIKINYNKKYQSPNTDAMVLGWGHTTKYRKPGDTTDYNQQELQYSPIQIMNKPECKKMYKNTPALFPLIDKYMICAMNEGNLDDKGDSIKRPHRYLADGCPRGSRRVGDECLPSGPSEYQRQDKDPSYDYLGEPNSHEYRDSPPMHNPEPNSYEYQDSHPMHNPEPNSHEYQDSPPMHNPVRKHPSEYQDENPLVDKPVKKNKNPHLNKYQDLTVSKTVNKYPTEYQNKRPLMDNPVKTIPTEYPDLQLDNPGRSNLDEYPNDYQDKGEKVQDPTNTNPNENQDPPDYNPDLKDYQDPSVGANPQSQHQNPPVDDDIITFDDIILDSRKSDKKEKNKNFSSDVMGSRKAGICQNDHGGPLVTWVGKIERLIGVASVYRLDKSMSCIGPYLFTSTQCNGGFLDCVISGYYEEIKHATQPEDGKTTAATKNTPKEDAEETTKTEAITTEPTATESTATEPTATEPTTTESTTTETTTTETTTTETTTTETTTETTTTLETTTEKTPKINQNTRHTTSDESKKKGGRNKESDEYYGNYDEGIEWEIFRRSREYCNRPPTEIGFDVIERRISWKDHPDGPAANELKDIDYGDY